MNCKPFFYPIYPRNFIRNIQNVSVTDDNSVVAAITLDVSTPSFFMFFAIM